MNVCTYSRSYIQTIPHVICPSYNIREAEKKVIEK